MSEVYGQRLPSARLAWASTFILTLLFALAYLDRQIVSLMVEPISTEFGVGDFEISLLQGVAFAILYALCGVPFGMAVDRFSRRKVVFVGVMLWSIAAMACGLAQSFNQLLMARILIGAGEAALSPAAYSILADIFPKRRLTFALGVFMTGALMGSELSLALGGFILSHAANGASLPFLGELPAWRYAFIVTGAPGMLLAFLIFIVPEPARATRDPAAAKKDESWGAVFRFITTNWRFFLPQMFGFSLVMGMVYIRLAWTPTFIMRTFGWDVARTSYTLASLTFAVGASALLLSGRVVDYFFARGVTDAHFRYYVVGGLLMAIFGPLAFLSTNPLLFFIFLAIPIFPLNMGAIGASSVQLATPPALRGRVSAIYLMIVALIGMSLGPAVVGFLTDHVLGGKQAIGLAIALAFGVMGPIVSILFWSGLGAMRRAVAANT